VKRHASLPLRSRAQSPKKKRTSSSPQKRLVLLLKQGHITSSIHMPDGGDWSVQMPRLLSIIHECLETSGPPVTVLFHCMESVRRGPRCAFLFPFSPSAAAVPPQPLWCLCASLATGISSDPRRCARRLFQELKMSGQITDDKLAMPFAIKVLQGGADQWMRNFYSDTRLVEAYNNDIWGYLDD
jgi:hypothetical protein